MSLSIEWWNKIINVPKAYLTLVQSSPTEIRELDINQFHQDLRELEAASEGILWLATHNHTAPVDVGGVTLARVVELVNGYTVTFEDGQYAVNIQGGNSNIGDNTNVNQVSVRSFNSGGLVTSDGIESIEYEQGIWIDTTSSNTGSIYPTGTFRKPVNNLDDALIAASVKGFDTFYIIGNITLGATDNIDGYRLVGQGRNISTITISSGCSTDNSEFRECVITGYLSGMVTIHNATIGTLVGFIGDAFDCGLEGNITLDGTSSELAQFINCYLATVAVGVITIDMNGDAAGLSMRNYTGGVRIENKSGNSKVVIDFLSGRVEIASDVTSGTFFLRGIGEITSNEATGITVNDSALIMKHIEYIKSMIGKNTVVEYTYDGSDNIGATFYFYNSAANANTHDKATGLIDTLTMTATFSAGKPTIMKVIE